MYWHLHIVDSWAAKKSPKRDSTISILYQSFSDVPHDVPHSVPHDVHHDGVYHNDDVGILQSLCIGEDLTRKLVKKQINMP